MYRVATASGVDEVLRKVRAFRFCPPASWVAAAGFVSAVAACDPVYQVGARQYLTPVRQTRDSASGARTDRRAAEVADVSLTAGCIDTVLHASTTVSDVRPWDHAKVRRGSTAGTGFAIHDSAFGSRPSYANLHLEAWRKERPMVEILFSWIGTARTYPMEEQRAMVRVTTALLQQLRTACLPEAPDAIECVAEGFGGHEACHIAH